MNWVDIVVIIILILSFVGGAKDGAVKSFSSLVALVIAIPVTGRFYHFIAGFLSFLPGTDWENFLGFFITMGIISAILQLIFLLPRKLIQAIWRKGILFRLLGGVLNLLGATIGMTVFVLVLNAYPIFDWLERWVSGSGVLISFVVIFGFVQAMLPQVPYKIAPIVMLISK